MIYISSSTFSRTYAHTHTYVNTETYTCKDTPTNIHTWLEWKMRTHTYTHTHTHTQRHWGSTVHHFSLCQLQFSFVLSGSTHSFCQILSLLQLLSAPACQVNFLFCQLQCHFFLLTQFNFVLSAWQSVHFCHRELVWKFVVIEDSRVGMGGGVVGRGWRLFREIRLERANV